jgi:hypothetical protein
MIQVASPNTSQFNDLCESQPHAGSHVWILLTMEAAIEDSLGTDVCTTMHDVSARLLQPAEVIDRSDAAGLNEDGANPFSGRRRSYETRMAGWVHLCIHALAGAGCRHWSWGQCVSLIPERHRVCKRTPAEIPINLPPLPLPSTGIAIRSHGARERS